MPLDPDAAKILEAIKAAGRPPYHLLSADAARAQYAAARAAVTRPPEPIDAVQDLTIPGPENLLKLRLYRPSSPGAGSLPALLYFHGGGWVLGDLDSHDAVCRALANRAGFLVVSVDYRLAPEHKYPGAVEDAAAALDWLVAEGAGHGADPARIAVGGDSAGGNLAAVLCLLEQAAGRMRIRYQLLIYPATDFALQTESQRAFSEGHLLTRADQIWFHQQYLRSEPDRTDWRASPLLAPTLQGLPPAFVLTAEFDPLRDEGEAYAERLENAGVAVEKWRVPGQIHGFLPMGAVVQASDMALDRLAQALRESGLST